MRRVWVRWGCEKVTIKFEGYQIDRYVGVIGYVGGYRLVAEE
jgi:hypothetical protein